MQGPLSNGDSPELESLSRLGQLCAASQRCFSFPLSFNHCHALFPSFSKLKRPAFLHTKNMNRALAEHQDALRDYLNMTYLHDNLKKEGFCRCDEKDHTSERNSWVVVADIKLHGTPAIRIFWKQEDNKRFYEFACYQNYRPNPRDTLEIVWCAEPVPQK
eukprot:m.199840 g.199840  ORF g.199840 m.199840 type:complete len:160 (-) comp25927_c3_seq1:161-640(-)